MSRTKITGGYLAGFLLWTSTAAFAATGTVSGQVVIRDTNGAIRSNRDAGVVLWLSPLPDQAALHLSTQNGSHNSVLVQKNKAFDPHVVAVQVGSDVDFPNRDPFFHNVFSLFNGKRFDLGLYEAGSTRAVHFDRPGVCYIFCNIHPQMSAVVVVVDTPHFAVSDARGRASIHDVMPGRYQLNVWEEQCSPPALKQLSRQVTVGGGVTSLGRVAVQESMGTLMAHLNKYGKQYDREVFPSPVYVQP